MAYCTLHLFMAMVLIPGLAVGGSKATPNPMTGQPKAGVTTKEFGGAPEELWVGGKVAGKQVEPKPDDICLVCDKPVGKSGAVYMVNGQRVVLHGGLCYTKFLKNPWHFLALLQARGAFLGAGPGGQTLSITWFLLGLYILAGLIFAALCAHRALHAGHSAVAWFGIGLLINLFGFLWLLTRSRKEIGAPAGVPAGLNKIAATHPPRTCPQCGEANHPSAARCSGCGATLQPTVMSEVEKVRIGQS